MMGPTMGLRWDVDTTLDGYLRVKCTVNISYDRMGSDDVYNANVDSGYRATSSNQATSMRIQVRLSVITVLVRALCDFAQLESLPMVGHCVSTHRFSLAQVR